MKEYKPPVFHIFVRIFIYVYITFCIVAVVTLSIPAILIQYSHHMFETELCFFACIPILFILAALLLYKVCKSDFDSVQINKDNEELIFKKKNKQVRIRFSDILSIEVTNTYPYCILTNITLVFKFTTKIGTKCTIILSMSIEEKKEFLNSFPKHIIIEEKLFI